MNGIDRDRWFADLEIPRTLIDATESNRREGAIAWIEPERRARRNASKSDAAVLAEATVDERPSESVPSCGAVELRMAVRECGAWEPHEVARRFAWIRGVAPDWTGVWWDRIESLVVEQVPLPKPKSRAATRRGSTARRSHDLPDAPTDDSFEGVIGRVAPSLRRRLGIWHTPEPLVAHVWRQAEAFGFESGDWIDPAAGTGVFLREGIARVARRSTSGRRVSEIESLLERSVGIEITFGAWLVGLLSIARTLDRFGHDLIARRPLAWHWGDGTRTEPADGGVPEAARQDYRLVIGNPPFSSRVESSHPWIERLLHGEVPGPGGSFDYYRFDGRPLGERKSWLHDLYVRFFRLAQWWTATSDRAVVALVSNRGWLDHRTFRGMRQALAGDFATIRIDQPPAGTSWFDVATETCVAVLRRDRSATTDNGRSGGIRRREVIFTASDSPETTISDRAVVPSEERFEFAVGDAAAEDALSTIGWPLTSIFIDSASAIVTARDRLVIAPTRAELLRRAALLADPEVDDERLREAFFRKARSRRFESGDTRHRSLEQLREQVRRLRETKRGWRGLIRSCRYRGLDDRYFVWEATFVDWPRFTAQATLGEGDWGVIARRQSPVDRPADYVLFTDRPVIDGVLRSDNRGNESIFPLHRIDATGQRVTNLKDDWLRAFEAIDRSDAEASRRSFAYLYALLRASSFRQRFRDELVREFPAVPLIADREFVDAVVALGLDLIARQAAPCGDFGDRVAEEDWPRLLAWTIGAHAPLTRWLRDRGTTFGAIREEGERTPRGRRFARLAATIRATIEAEEEIDRRIASFGGWEQLSQRCVVPQGRE